MTIFPKQIKQILCLFLMVLTLSCDKSEPNSISIATAANMQFAMQALTKSFTEKTGISCEIATSSSGKLTAQIIEGAPYDIFVSADMRFPNKLFKENLTVYKPVVYAYGKLIMWTMIDTLKPSFDQLNSQKINHIAIANPTIAPYGIAAKEVLQNKNLYAKLSDKFVFGESVAQTNQFITTQAAEIGFTALSVVHSSQMKEKGNYVLVDESLYTPISQGIVLLKNEKENKKNAQAFYKFVLSDEGKSILTKFGYAIK